MVNSLKSFFISLKDLLKRIHSKVPPKLRFLYFPLTWGYKQTRELYKMIYLAVFVFEGKDPSGELPFSYAYVGNRPSEQAYFYQMLLLSGFRQHSLGSHFFWEVPAIIRKSNFDCSMIIFEINLFTEIFLYRKYTLKIPCWIDMAIDISQSMEELQKLRKYRQIQRNIQENELDFEVTCNPASFKEYYYDMYLPHMKKRYRDTAVIDSFSHLEPGFSHSEVFFIKQKGVALGGTMLKYCKGGKVLCCLFAVKDGDPKYLELGVMGANYYFPILAMQKKGYKQIIIGGCRPFFRDGLTRYKISLGGEIIPHFKTMKACIGLVPLKNSPALKNFLVQNPFVFYPTGRKPVRALFVDSSQFEKQKDFKKVFVSSNCKGLKGTRIFVFGEDNNISQWLSTMDCSNTFIQPAENIFCAKKHAKKNGNLTQDTQNKE
ncbi:hypothetical protein ACFL2Y_00725 [Candidatus Omnitrophota bacterium]